MDDFQNLLYDIFQDPEQRCKWTAPEIGKSMIGRLVRMMPENDAPPEQYERLGLTESLRKEYQTINVAMGVFGYEKVT
ncbi:hypothetical protein [Paenibacillus hamazuiensis]|uniref:hypothetical protein n=1 Tax=Paenibacillus hamazuiensis TaxID=2936508 RepID=UPI00200D8104|nr:hypothetical protein [Paenibacillus hamazuiensis]